MPGDLLLAPNLGSIEPIRSVIIAAYQPQPDYSQAGSELVNAANEALRESKHSCSIETLDEHGLRPSMLFPLMWPK